MKITPVASPLAIPQNGTPEHVRTARAVAAFNGQGAVQTATPASTPPAQAQNSPINGLDANNVSPEEMSAVKAPSDVQQMNTSETVVSEAADASQSEAPNSNQVDTEPIPEQTVEVDSEKDSLSKQFAQLARQERALRAKMQAQEQALKAREAELKAKEIEIQSKSQFDAGKYISKDQLKQNALLALAEAGIDYNELTQQILDTSQIKTDPRTEATIKQLEAKIAALERQNESSLQQQQEREQAQYKAALQQIKTDVKALVNSDPSFETIKATNSVDDVVELIERRYKEDGVIMSNEEAAQAIEDYLVDEALKLARLSKIQNKLKPVAPAKATAQKSAAQQPSPAIQQSQPQMKTLTNANSAPRQLSARERAILAMRGELNKR